MRSTLLALAGAVASVWLAPYAAATPEGAEQLRPEAEDTREGTAELPPPPYLSPSEAWALRYTDCPPPPEIAEDVSK